MARKRLTVKEKKLRENIIKRDLIKVLDSCENPESLANVLQFLNRGGREAIYHAIWNYMYHPKSKPVAELEKHEKVLELLCNCEENEAKKKRILVQKGGQFLAPILGTVLPLVANWIFGNKK
jgi:hypothetical protein